MPRTSVAAGAASLLGSRIAVALLALIFLGVSTRLLTLEEMAVFALYNIFAGLVTVVCSLGLLAAAVRDLPALEAAGRREEASGLIRLALVGQTGLGVLLTAGVAAAADPISRLILKTPAWTTEVRLAAGAALCFGLHDAMQLILNGLQRYDRLAANNVITAIAQRGLSLGLFFVFGIRGYLAGFAAGSLLGALFGARAAWSALSIRPVLPAGWRAREVIRALPFYADGYLRYLSLQADQIVAGIFLPPAALSIYFIAKRYLQYCQMLVQSLLEPIGTRVAGMRENRPGAIWDVYDRTGTLFYVIFVPLAAMLAAASPLLLRILGGARYDAGVVPLALLMLSVIPYAFFSHVASFVFVLGAPADRLRSNVVAAGVQIVSMALLLPGLGLAGLAAARGAGFLAGAGWGRRVLATGALPDSGPGPGDPWRTVRRGAGVLMAAAAGAITLLPWLATGNPSWIAVLALPVTALCSAALLRYILTASERSALADLVPGQGRGATTVRTWIDPER